MNGSALSQGSIDRGFLSRVAKTPGGERVADCIQCGTCSGSCPTAHLMDYTPRRLFAMINAGLREAVLDSNTFWYCTSCYTCTVRCPRQIKITDVMYALKRMARQESRSPRGAAARAFYTSFVGIVERDGRSFEPELMTRFMLRTNPLKLARQSTLGLKLLKRGRFPVRRTRIEGLKQLRAIIKQAKLESEE
jgi:heterodisulfide reductase subunit C